jgi:hypothetical protein
MLVGVDEGNIGQIITPLANAIDGLLNLDHDGLGDAELAEATLELHRQQARLAAAVTRVTAAVDARRVWADDGSRSCGAWVAHRSHLPVGQAGGAAAAHLDAAEAQDRTTIGSAVAVEDARTADSIAVSWSAADDTAQPTLRPSEPAPVGQQGNHPPPAA